MNNTRTRIVCSILFGLLFMPWAHAQVDDPFLRRLGDIKLQLDLLSDSLAPGLNETANFSVSGLPIQTFLRTLAESHDLNIQVEPALNIALENNFTSVRVKEIIYFLCQEYQLDIRFINTIMSFTKYQLPVVVISKPLPKKLKIEYNPATRRISLDLSRDSLLLVVKEITRISDRNVMLSGADLEGKLVTGFFKDLPLESALEKLAYINSIRLIRTKDDVFILESDQPVSNPPGMARATASASPSRSFAASSDILVKDSLISLDVTNYSVLEIINQVSAQLGINYILFSDVTGSTTAKVKRVRFTEMLSFLFQGTPYTFKEKKGIYLIGQRNQEGFRISEVIKLDFRTIEGVEKEIPSDLTKEVELKVLKELNSFIVTGNKQKIDELVTFIKLIDQPIPNILIEVIVAEAQKNFSLQTGIKAFLSDSVPETSGQVLGGVDLTLSSQSVNNILGKLSSKGIANLGKVTPGFYATLQALETNNNIQIRSTPKLSAMNGSKANLTIGESQYYVEETQSITGGVSSVTNTTQQFNKVEANLAITISPVVSGNEHITLDIVAEFSDFTEPVVENAPPGNSTRKFESKIRVKNDEVIILGGLESQSRTDGSSGVPLLSKIPVLKWLFSSKTRKREDNRLIVFIRPTLVY